MNFKCVDLDQQFNTQAEMFAALKQHEQKIVAVKKAMIQKSYEKQVPVVTFLDKEADEQKTIHLKEGYIYPVINTTLYMDSHRDVHLNGIWKHSVKDQQGKLLYLVNHQLEIGKVIAWQKDIAVMVKSVPWSFLGQDYEGNTEALMFEINKSNVQMKDVLELITNKRPVQNSVSMQYVTVRLAMNSDAKGDEAYKQFYDSIIETIANKDQVKALGYFWGVSEAKIVNEGSMVVLGSNPITPIKEKSAEAEDITSKGATEESQHSAPRFNYSHLL